MATLQLPHTYLTDAIGPQQQLQPEAACDSRAKIGEGPKRAPTGVLPSPGAWPLLLHGHSHLTDLLFCKLPYYTETNNNYQGYPTDTSLCLPRLTFSVKRAGRQTSLNHQPAPA